MENEEDDRQMKIAASIASAVVIGFIKEDWDLYRGEGIADFYDWSYTIVGGIIGTIMTDWIYRKIPNL